MGQAFIASLLAKHSSEAAAAAGAAQADGDGGLPSEHACMARQWLRIILGAAGPGSDSLGHNGFVAGVGSGVCQVAHRGSSCPTNSSLPCDCSALLSLGCNPSPLVGALVGGPALKADGTGMMDIDSWASDRQDYQTSEPAIDYNTGFLGALAAQLEQVSRVLNVCLS